MRLWQRRKTQAWIIPSASLGKRNWKPHLEFSKGKRSFPATSSSLSSKHKWKHLSDTREETPIWNLKFHPQSIPIETLTMTRPLALMPLWHPINWKGLLLLADAHNPYQHLGKVPYRNCAAHLLFSSKAHWSVTWSFHHVGRIFPALVRRLRLEMIVFDVTCLSGKTWYLLLSWEPGIIRKEISLWGSSSEQL